MCGDVVALRACEDVEGMRAQWRPCRFPVDTRGRRRAIGRFHLDQIRAERLPERLRGGIKPELVLREITENYEQCRRWLKKESICDVRAPHSDEHIESLE